jgi:hypothetical protein
MMAGMAKGRYRYLTACSMACVALSLDACATQLPTAAATSAELQSEYQRAIGAAAVRHPDWNIPLWSFGDARVVVVSTLTDDPALDTVTQHNWVAATAEVRPRCQGQADALLFLEKLLGLPPEGAPNGGKRWHVYTFEVSQDALFRPCPGGVDRSSPRLPRCIAGTALDSTLDEETARFLLHQFWYSHRAAIPSGDGVEFGYPWTAMGWTYNWDPQSTSHIGVSEFVVRPGASVSHLRDESPAEFCNHGTATRP